MDSKHGAIETWLDGFFPPFGLTSWVFFYYAGYAVGAGDEAFHNPRLIESVDWLAGMLFRSELAVELKCSMIPRCFACHILGLQCFVRIQFQWHCLFQDG